MAKKEIKDGIIEPGDGLFGFTRELFFGYLWKSGGDIYVSFIESLKPGKGNFRRLILEILGCGYTVKIPTPLGDMVRIVRKNGFKKTIENGELGDAEVWVKHPVDINEKEE